jgi:ATP-dependent exoDNAse (exonuclease V) beta subunit
LSSEFEQPDYQDLYENHSHQKSNDKLVVNISFIPKEESTEEVEEGLDKTFYVLETLNTIHKVLEEGFEYKDIVILTRKRSQGIAIANYLTEQNIPLVLRDVDDPKRNRGEADYSSLKYLKTMLI